jgi:hypothetical protein
MYGFMVRPELFNVELLKALLADKEILDGIGCVPNQKNN